MNSSSRSALFTHALFCWNWKCALLSATARSLVYLAAMARAGNHGRLAVVLASTEYNEADYIRDMDEFLATLPESKPDYFTQRSEDARKKGMAALL